MATENTNGRCDRCGENCAILYRLVVTCSPAYIKSSSVCQACKGCIFDYVMNPPKYHLVTLNPMTNQWVPRSEPMTLADIVRTIPLLGSAAYRVYDFTLSLSAQAAWWQANIWALRNARGEQGAL